MKNNIVSTLLKGIGVGGTMLVPGVSGGSMAMMLGIYDKLISSVSSFRKDIKASLTFLGLFSLGGLLGMVIFAKPILGLIENYPMPMMYFFMGAVVGSIPMIYHKAQVGKVGIKEVIYIIVGLVIVILMDKLPIDVVSHSMGSGVSNNLFLILTGGLAAIAIVLPGISVSYMLLLLGIYDTTMRAISEFYLPYILPLGIGLLLGIILTSKILETVMQQYPRLTYLLILGFILGSVGEVFPGIPVGKEFILCLIMLAVGFGVIRLLSYNE